MTTSSVDLERVLDGLLGPDPSDRLSDRVFAATFERTTTTTQRRSVGVPMRSRPHMSPMLRVLAIAAALAVFAGGALFIGSQQRTVDVPPSIQPTVAPQAPSPAVTVAPSPTPAATPMPTVPPLTTQYDSPSYGYSVTMPDDYRLFPAKQPWRPFTDSNVDSPAVERIVSTNYLVWFTARSHQLDRPMTSAEWLQQFSAYPGAPLISMAGCTASPITWQNVTIDGEPAFQVHEQCGGFWLVVAKGDRGYVFMWRIGVEDEPKFMDPYRALIQQVQASIRLTPSTAKDPVAASPSP
jgi:hypothetical protein